MLHRSHGRGCFLWGTSLAGLVSLLAGASAQPPPDFAVVAGTVRGPDGPLPEEAATVTLTLEQPLEEGGEFATWSKAQTLQAEGRFRFPEVPPGKYRLMINAEGFAEQFLERLVVREGRTYDWDVSVFPTSVVRGQIRRVDGPPLANTQVYLNAVIRLPHGHSGSGRQVTTDAEGQYEFPVEGGVGAKVQITLMQPGEGYAFTPPLLLAPGETRAGVDLRLQPGYTLTGVAREADTQAPIPNLKLSLQASAYLEDVVGLDVSVNSATTDAAGAFTFRNLPPGIYTVSAGDPMAPVGRQRVLILGQEEGPISVDLAFRRLPTLTIRLRQPDGSPLAAARVPCRWEQHSRNSSGSSSYQATTDAEGCLSFPLFGMGTFHLTLTLAGYQPVSLENILFFGDDPGPELEVTLQELPDE